MACLEADCLDAQLFGHCRLVLPNLPDHRLGRASQSLDDALQLDHERRVDRVVARLKASSAFSPQAIRIRKTKMLCGLAKCARLAKNSPS